VTGWLDWQRVWPAACLDWQVSRRRATACSVCGPAAACRVTIHRRRQAYISISVVRSLPATLTPIVTMLRGSAGLYMRALFIIIRDVDGLQLLLNMQLARRYSGSMQSVITSIALAAWTNGSEYWARTRDTVVARRDLLICHSELMYGPACTACGTEDIDDRTEQQQQQQVRQCIMSNSPFVAGWIEHLRRPTDLHYRTDNTGHWYPVMQLMTNMYTVSTFLFFE